MRVLIYKRTHNGDPDKTGCFGAEDCMGAVRNRDFEAVIGVGGMGAEAEANDISAKINWVGIGPCKRIKRGKRGSEWRGPLVTFNHFLDFGTNGPELRDLAPTLAKRMYSKKVRHVMDGLREHELLEAMEILELAKDAPPSPGRTASCSSSAPFDRCASKRRTIRCSRPGPRLRLRAR